MFNHLIDFYSQCVKRIKATRERIRMVSKIIAEVSILDVVKMISRRNKKLQAVLLQEVEKHYSQDSTEYQELRKVILDETSNFSRAVIRQIFGDIEVLIN